MHDGPARAQRLRVASVPATHVYVRGLASPRVERLRDPSGDDRRTPCFLSPEWVRSHARDLDLLHVHFGFEFYEPARLEEVCRALRRTGTPLVYTAHDLRNPNHPAPDLHDAGLEVWMRHADAVVTLTDWAAEQIWRRWRREALVLPHPHVVPLDELARRQARPRPRHADRFRVGLHYKSLRPNMVGAASLRAALDAARGRDGLRLRVDMHDDVFASSGRHHDAELVDLAARGVAEGLVDLHVHTYFSDDELWDWFESVDAVVLPYRFGTHSGWLEAARDLGTAVIAPSCGGYAAQGAQAVFRSDEESGLDHDSLVRAVHAVADSGRPDPVPVARRAAQQGDVAAAHVALYERLLARDVATAS